MDELAKQLGGLLLSAVPTIILLIVLATAYNFLVHRPLSAALAERHSKTEGAVAKAQADVAAAQAKTAEYEQRLREARSQVLKNAEARRKQLADARAAAISQARATATEKVSTAKAELDKETATAKTGLQAQSEQLANEVIGAVLKTASAGGRA
ncbi:MAG TPA: ATP synthase F0 subunit B [Planctomycetota bacterium]|nr:ATP synthase F0 subunit B [Planctomycetota bacterium]